MQLTLDKIFLILGIISFPNLFFRGQYNVPLFLFFFACWKENSKPFIFYSLIFSWILDVYLLAIYIGKDNNEIYYQTGEKGQIVLIISLILLISKTIIIIYLSVFQRKCYEALFPRYIYQNIKKLKNFQVKQNTIAIN